MATIDVNEMQATFAEVEKGVSYILTQKGKGSLHSFQQGQKPHLIASTINEILNTNLQGSTIQQTFYYKLRKLSVAKNQEDKIGVSDEYSNAFRNFLNVVEEMKKNSPETKTVIPLLDKYSPSRPEFPEDNPAFPASPHYQLPIPGFKRVWIKDESYNPSGTHKDRKAYELLIYLQDQIRIRQEKEKADGRRRPVEFPAVSIISSGNEAYALQNIFNSKGYPALRVILDKKHKNSKVEANLRAIGCKLWFEDIEDIELKTEDVLRITKNPTGYDVTTHLNQDLIEKRYKFYDWLSFEILNLSPHFCFIPVGTGDLFLNILEFNKMEIEKHRRGDGRDNRFFGHIDVLTSCNFIGASTKNQSSNADKLVTKFNSCWDPLFQEHIQNYIQGNFCGKSTGTYEINEKLLKIAVEYLNELGITAEPSGAAGLAVFFSMIDDLPKDKTIVIVNTGKLKVKSVIEKRARKVSAIMKKLKKVNEQLTNQGQKLK